MSLDRHLLTTGRTPSCGVKNALDVGPLDDGSSLHGVALANERQADSGSYRFRFRGPGERPAHRSGDMGRLGQCAGRTGCSRGSAESAPGSGLHILGTRKPWSCRWQLDLAAGSRRFEPAGSVGGLATGVAMKHPPPRRSEGGAAPCTGGHPRIVTPNVTYGAVAHREPCGGAGAPSPGGVAVKHLPPRRRCRTMHRWPSMYRNA